MKSGIPGRVKKVYHPFSIIHHTAISKNEYKGEETIREIDRMHREKGFYLIGYHFIITPDGKIFEGRKIFEEGAHTRKFNFAVGIALFGNFEKEKIEYNQKISLFKILDFLAKKYFIRKFSFHFLFSKNTVCGGKIFEEFIKDKKSKKIFIYPSDLSYNSVSGPNPIQTF